MERFPTFTMRKLSLPARAATVLLISAVTLLSACATTSTGSATDTTSGPVVSTASGSVVGVDAGTHIGKIWRADIHEDTGLIATTSDDKTVRLWSLEDGEMLSTLRFPTTDARAGKLYAIDIHPDGKLIAVSGRAPAADGNTPIYLVNIDNNQLVERICCVTGDIYHLEFSPDGEQLAVVVSNTDAGGSALHIYKAGNQWWEKAYLKFPKAQYSLWLAHSSDGRLAVSSFDGKVRLFDAEGVALAVSSSLSGQQPVAIAFNPVNDMLAVGYTDEPFIDLLEGSTLELINTIAVSDLGDGSLSKVAWSPDGEILYAGANAFGEEGVPFFAWDEQGFGTRSESGWGETIASALIPLENGDVFIATQEPTIRRLEGIDKLRWEIEPASLRLSDMADSLKLSADGNTLQLATDSGEVRYFNVASLLYSEDSQVPALPPQVTGLDITDWQASREPKLNGQVLEMQPLERSLSLAIDAKAEHFVLGTDWALRYFSASGDLLWVLGVEAGAYRINISSDGSKVVAALYDGTIRWYNAVDGSELLSLFLYQDISKWAAWTPNGLIAASDDALDAAYELQQGELSELPEILSIDGTSDRLQPAAVAGALGTIN